MISQLYLPLDLLVLIKDVQRFYHARHGGWDSSMVRRRLEDEAPGPADGGADHPALAGRRQSVRGRLRPSAGSLRLSGFATSELWLVGSNVLYICILGDHQQS